MNYSDGPNPSKRVLRWYRFRLESLFAGEAREHPEVNEAFISWFAHQPDRFLCWRVADEYRGAGSAMGGWSVNAQAILAAVPEAQYALTGIPHRPFFGPPIEPAAARLVREIRQEAFCAERKRVERTWPLLCVDCETEFQPGRRGILRCPGCRRSARGGVEES